METFTEAYGKLRDVMGGQVFEAEWQTFLANDAKVKGLLADDGPEPANAAGLDKIRTRLGADTAKRPETILKAAKAGGPAPLSPGEALARGAVTGAVSTIATLAGGPLAGMGATLAAMQRGSVAERAAALKMLSHLYRAQKRGGQDVWVYAPPKSYQKWIFDEIAGSDQEIKTKLGKADEVYSASDREIMCTALGCALKWSLDAVTKLAAGSAETKTMVRRWFADQDTTDAQVDAAAAKLKDGFKKIADTCNSPRLVFSDDPIDRVKVYNAATGKVGWDDWGFVGPSEKMDIIYIQNAFLKAGATGRMWKCALTIVHEVSHRSVGTDDNMYDFAGLSPDKTKFSHAKALGNADSWAYFATDLAGMLAATDRTTVLKLAA